MTRWKDGQPPEIKMCNGCGKTLSYTNDFYQTSRKTSRGLVWYATQPCIGCMAERDRRKKPEERVQKPELTMWEVEKRRKAKRRYHREYYRMRVKLETGRTVVGRIRRGRGERIRLEAHPWLEWLEAYVEYEGLVLYKLCDKLGVSFKVITTARKEGWVPLDVAEKFFVHAGYPELLQVFYDGGERRAA